MDERAYRAVAHGRHGRCDIVKKDYFISPDHSHGHSLETLNLLYEYDDFMESIRTMADMGCGQGYDLEWWATRTTRDEAKKPLNIKCWGVDRADNLPMARRYANLYYQCQDFETNFLPQKRKFDVVWCHDSFQYAINPLATLKSWHGLMSKDAMLGLILPQSTNIEYRQQAYDQRDLCYFNWTMVSLIHALAVSGFDCAGGFFKKMPDDPWLHAIVYRSDTGPQEPSTTSWYQLAELNLLPQTAVHSINKHGYVRQRDLVLPWLDKSLMSFAQH